MNLAHKVSVSWMAAAVLLMANGSVASDPPKKEARVTKIIREVKLLPSDESPRPAAENDQVSENTAVRTGEESRSELTFDDLTITRLGANTIFSFNKAGRSGQLGSGSILVHVPKDSGGGQFRTNAVTVAVAGTTLIFAATPLGDAQLIVLEGGAWLGLVKYPRQTRNVRAGQLLDVQAGATQLSAPVNVDLDRIMKTYPLITEFPPLPSQDFILAVIQEQQAKASGGSPVSPGKPGRSNTLPPAGQGIPMFTPPPRPMPTPRIITLPPRPTPPPRPAFSAPPRPAITPKETPRPSPRPTRTPKGKRPPPRPIKPPKKGTPTPTPSPRIF